MAPVMDFWGAKRQAQKKTWWYLLLFAVMLITVAVASELALRYYLGKQYQPPEPWLAIGFVLITIGVGGFNYLMYGSQGGSYVAESLGGQRIDLATQDFKEKQLLNIVEEMALAAGMPVPPVFILEAEQINAFAAGLSPDDAAIAITRGALHTLSREEIQGVIAHEFSHIYHGDMLLNMRLAAMIMAFFFLVYMAFRILQFSAYTGGGRSRGKDKSGNPTLVIALILLVAGAVSWCAGSVLRSMISRQREYLADASAVQYTRNPKGLLGALQKISTESKHDMPKEGGAYAHLYFSGASSWFSQIFSTHPPIDKRIAALKGEDS
jgi:heat shock protein HtpX